jgi:hypothetical protein
MKKSLFAAAALFLATSGIAYANPVPAQITSETTKMLTDEDGNMIREVIREKRIAPVQDTQFDVKVGVEVPTTIQLNPLPETIHIKEPASYSYVVVGEKPVIVERKTRRVVHIYYI